MKFIADAMLGGWQGGSGFWGLIPCTIPTYGTADLSVSPGKKTDVF